VGQESERALVWGGGLDRAGLHCFGHSSSSAVQWCEAANIPKP